MPPPENNAHVTKGSFAPWLILPPTPHPALSDLLGSGGSCSAALPTRTVCLGEGGAFGGSLEEGG